MKRIKKPEGLTGVEGMVTSVIAQDAALSERRILVHKEKKTTQLPILCDIKLANRLAKAAVANEGVRLSV